MSGDGSSESKVEDAKPAAAYRWQIVHTALVGIAKVRAGLDAEEATWLREAEQLQIWKQYAMVSMVDYLERVCGYEPRAGQYRMRVARALGDLPALNEALRTGDLCFSAVRELVRVATPATEQAWCEAAQGKNLRQIEEIVAGHRLGSHPDDAVEEDARLHEVTYHEVTASTFALLRQARHALTQLHGRYLTDSDVLAAFANAVLSPESANPPAKVSGRARSQIGYVVCRVCDRAWQQGGGRNVPISPPELEVARCNAQHIGNLDADKPERAKQDIPPATVRLVWARDQGRCQTPGCRSSFGVDIHHLVHRRDGGTHDPSNLTLRCSSCHTAHHEGRLHIEGTAPDAITTRRIKSSERVHSVRRHAPEPAAPPSPGEAEPSSIVPPVFDAPQPAGASPVPAASQPLSRYAVAVRRSELVSALRQVGWTSSVARVAIETAIATLGPDAPTEDLLREALRACPTPMTKVR